MTASESWLLGLKTAESSDVLTETERKNLRPMKAGLLAAVCVPGCGQPQLRFFADFLSLSIITNGRIRGARDMSENGWTGEGVGGGVDALGRHTLFQHLLPELQRLVSKATSTWKTRFESSVRSYHSAQLQVITDRVNNVIPDLETYLPLRRELSGLYMLLDLIELCENLTLPPMDDETFSKFNALKQLAADIIGCSLDVVAFNDDQVQGNRHNLITVIMTHKRLSLQGALNLAGVLIKRMFDSFVETEKSLISAPTAPQTNYLGNGSLSSYWNWVSLSRLATPPASPPRSTPDPSNGANGGDLAHLGDLPSYVHTFRDCVVGTINWAYETELYFGKKGEEIRTFGWVFLNPQNDGDGEERS
ncbi:hypothetical protein LshimejAT787_1200840 [Lyophyllum shimeji]|uniref:Uncharacterized protein n=1 Tax=Lyophyllum shimeji TaxID=47721 RepID=A0A9P3PV81_LYOSH|nr:hypothetical protein LshimejAT787_1200840 [Lyophyllum shimeji]